MTLDLVGQAPKELGGDKRHVGREDDGHVGLGVTKRGDQPDDGRSHLAPVVDDVERETEFVARLAHDEDAPECFLEHAMRTLAEHLALKAGNGLRRTEAAACAANQEDARYLVPTAYHALA